MTWLDWWLFGCILALAALNLWAAHIIMSQSAMMREIAKSLRFYLQRENADQS